MEAGGGWGMGGANHTVVFAGDWGMGGANHTVSSVDWGMGGANHTVSFGDWGMGGANHTIAAVAVTAKYYTAAERLWAEHAGRVSGAALLSATMLVLAAAVHVAGLSALVLPRLLPAAAAAKLQPAARSNSAASMVRAYATIVLIFGSIVAPLMLCSYPVFEFLGMRTRLPLPTLPEIAAQNAVYFLIEDYVVYWLHRWYHTEWAYKTFHHVHHEFTAPGGFAAIYAHPLEILLEFVPILVGIALVPPHVVTFWVWVAAMHLHAFEIHSGYEWRWSPTKLIPFYGGSRYHDYHHEFGSRCASNFAHCFTIFDTIHGTNKGYLYRVNKKKQQRGAGKSS